MHFVQYLSAFSVHLSMIQETRGILRSISVSTTIIIIPKYYHYVNILAFKMIDYKDRPGKPTVLTVG